jgi:hypothetical protein
MNKKYIYFLFNNPRNNIVSAASNGRMNFYIVACLLKVRTVEPEKWPLLGNGCVTRNNGITVGGDILYALRDATID